MFKLVYKMVRLTYLFMFTSCLVFWLIYGYSIFANSPSRVYALISGASTIIVMLVGFLLSSDIKGIEAIRNNW